jgi:hypothetical protein
LELIVIGELSGIFKFITAGIDSLYLSNKIMHDRSQTGWYFENKIPNRTLALWLIDSTFCRAIADVDKQQLLTNLTESE